MAGNPIFNIGGVIASLSTAYVVERVLGSGTFGQVVECKKSATGETVAIKLLKKENDFQEAFIEEEMLYNLKANDSHNFNIVKFIDSFIYNNYFCLVFEKLDISLRQLLRSRRYLSLMEIRPVLKQLATALEFLKSIEIIHCDLKPQNIMLVDHERQPLRVKVIDFGLACDEPEEWWGVTIQTLWYRAPEVLLGCRFNDAVDVWSLGCITAEMFMGAPLFPTDDEYELMKHILHVIGQPSDDMLSAGQFTQHFFREYYDGLTPPKFLSILGDRNSTYPPQMNSLDVLRAVRRSELPRDEALADTSDRTCFVHLLCNMLNLDPSQRFTPSQILQHPFITMGHLVGAFDDSVYVKESIELMDTCRDVTSDDSKDVAPASSHCHFPEAGIPAGLNEGDSAKGNSPEKKRTDSRPDTTTVKKTPPSEVKSPLKKRRPAEDSTGQPNLKKRKQDDADITPSSEAKSSLKKRRPAEDSTGQPNLKKRKRDDADITPSSEAKSSLKKRRPAEDSTGQPNLKKRKRDDADITPSSEVKPPLKKRRLAEDSTGQPKLKKRKRDDADITPSSEVKPPLKEIEACRTQ